jgi:hypothetical protein
VFISGGFCIIKFEAFDIHEAHFQIPLDEPPQRHVSHVFWEPKEFCNVEGWFSPFTGVFSLVQMASIVHSFSCEVYAYRTNYMLCVSFSNVSLCVISYALSTSSCTVICHSYSFWQVPDVTKKEASFIKFLDVSSHGSFIPQCCSSMIIWRKKLEDVKCKWKLDAEHAVVCLEGK